MTLPPPSPRRVAVVGIGLVSPLGLTLADVERGLRSGASAIGLDSERKSVGFRSALRGFLPPFDPGAFLSKKDRKNMGEHVQFAAIAAAKAFEESSTDPALFAGERTGIVIGNDSSAGCATTVLDTTRGEGSTSGLGSGAVVRAMNSSPTINLGVKYKVRAASLTLSASDASGAHALGLASMMIRLGMADRMIAGGCQELCWEAMAPWDAAGVFSARESDPAGAARPFDRDRDGFVPSGGAAILLLEEMESAKARGAAVFGEILGFGSTTRGTSESAESAQARCIRQTIEQAGLAAKEIDYICASASGSVEGDLAEARAIAEVFGEPGPAVSSTKGMTGHEGWMSGASQAAYALLMMRGGFIAPSVNFAGFAPHFPKLDIAATAREATVDHALVNCLGLAGAQACLALGRA